MRFARKQYITYTHKVYRAYAQHQCVYISASHMRLQYFCNLSEISVSVRLRFHQFEHSAVAGETIFYLCVCVRARRLAFKNTHTREKLSGVTPLLLFLRAPAYLAHTHIRTHKDGVRRTVTVCMCAPHCELRRIICEYVCVCEGSEDIVIARVAVIITCRRFVHRNPQTRARILTKTPAQM